jgi:hypothetical protein
VLSVLTFDQHGGFHVEVHERYTEHGIFACYSYPGVPVSPGRGGDCPLIEKRVP